MLSCKGQIDEQNCYIINVALHKRRQDTRLKVK